MDEIPLHLRCTRCLSASRPRVDGRNHCEHCIDYYRGRNDYLKRFRASARQARAQAEAPAPVAQTVERLPCKQEVAGSVPAGGSGSVPNSSTVVPSLGTVAETQPVAQPRNSGDTGNGLRLVVADLHAPNQDERAFKALLAMMADNRFAELILLGDAVELASLAWWGGPTTLQAYKDEAIKARHVLNRLLAQHGGPTTLVIGNHDGRADQKVERSAPQLHGSIKDEIGWDALGVRLVQEDQQPLIRGRLRFIHGHQDCGRNPPLRYAFKLAQLYGEPGTSVIAGHCHRDQSDSKPQHGGPVMAYLLGTLESRPKWLKTADSWTCSVAVADPESGCVQVLPIRDGVMWFGGVRYSSS